LPTICPYNTQTSDLSPHSHSRFSSLTPHSFFSIPHAPIVCGMWHSFTVRALSKKRRSRLLSADFVASQRDFLFFHFHLCSARRLRLHLRLLARRQTQRGKAKRSKSTIHPTTQLPTLPAGSSQAITGSHLLHTKRKIEGP